MGSFREPHKTNVSNGGTNGIVEDISAKKKAMKMQSGFISNFRVSAELLKKGMFERMTKPMAQALIESANESRRVEQSLVVIPWSNGYCNKNSLPAIGFAMSKLAL